jgi:hypothetical protein
VLSPDTKVTSWKGEASNRCHRRAAAGAWCLLAAGCVVGQDDRLRTYACRRGRRTGGEGRHLEGTAVAATATAVPISAAVVTAIAVVTVVGELAAVVGAPAGITRIVDIPAGVGLGRVPRRRIYKGVWNAEGLVGALVTEVLKPVVGGWG